MKLKSLLVPASLLICLACNNSSDKSETATDTTKHEEADHTHTMPTGEVPALPEVPSGAKVYFQNLHEGDNLKSPFMVFMGTDSIRIDTAGPVVAGSGHHHLIIDGGAVPSGDIIPKDSLHIHFGKGQTESTLSLPNGKHTLTLQFADGLHRSYGEKMSSTIHVNVKN